MISFRHADLFPTLEHVINPCLRWKPFHEKVSSKMFAIVIDSGLNYGRSKRNLAKEFPDVDMDVLDSCGVLKWAGALFRSNVTSLREVRQAFVLFSGDKALAFASKEVMEMAKAQLRSTGVFSFEGPKEDELNGQIVYFGTIDTSADHIYKDGPYHYYRVNRVSSNAPTVVYIESDK